MFSPVNLSLSALGALGVWMLLSALNSWLGGLSLPQRPGRVSLKASEQAIQADLDGQLNLFRSRPFFDRLFTPILADLTQLLRPMMGDAAQLERQLLAAGRPAAYATVADFMAWKIVMALAGFGFGLAIALLLGTLALVVPLALGGTLLGFLLPNRQLETLMRQRGEELVNEMAFVLDRLAILKASGLTLEESLVRVSDSEGGGWFTAELKQAARDYTVDGKLEPALRGMVARNPGIPDLERVVERMLLSTKEGLDLIDSLLLMATLARERLEQLLLARARENSIKMLLPVGLLMLPAMLLALLAPGFANILTALR